MTILLGDCRAVLPTLDAGSVRCVVTSPPYFGLRNYGVAGQLGLEKTPEEYVAVMVTVFREVRRVLADDGTLWLNLGDSYARTPGKGVKFSSGPKTYLVNRQADEENRGPDVPPGLKPKDLLGIPWRVAFALQADGWFLRSDIIWAKSNPMPESVTDRPTKSHEYVFLLSKRERYYYDKEAIAEKSVLETSTSGYHKQRRLSNAHQTSRPAGANRADYGDLAFRAGLLTAKETCAYCAGTGRAYDPPDQTDSTCRGCGGAGTISKDSRNARTVWTIPTQPTPDAHFATFPEALAERCILAGSAQGDTILDPFFGSGTVGKVAERLGRKWVGIELNPEYVKLAGGKTAQRGIFG
jgi:DNA modification methylase